MAGTTFAEVLEQVLEHRPSDIEHRTSGLEPWPPALEHRLGSFGPGPQWAARRYPRPAAPAVRPLGPAERHALDELNGLGARLRDDFTRAELRSAFRALARRHHPDRSMGQPPADQAHAARIFTFLVGHYRCLSAFCDSPS